MSRKLFINTNKYLQQIAGFILLMLFAHGVSAQVYKCENDAGNIIFSDEPCKKGQSSTRLNWIKSTPSSQKKKYNPNDVSGRAKKTARKAKKNNEAYVLLSLLTTTQLELETASLRSTLGDEMTEKPELLLPDGITVDLLKVDKMLISSSLKKNQIQVRFYMNDGYDEVKTIKKPYPVISGEAKIGRFSKSLEDIKRIEFFNSQKLLKNRGDSSTTPKQAKKSASNKKPAMTDKKDSEVIELDLSHEVQPKELPLKTTPKPVVKPAPKTPVNHIPVIFANDKTGSLLKNSLGSTKGSQTARAQHFILSDNEQIAYNKIKSIRVRPTADRSKLVVAVALKTGETKMENMLPPFTRIQGQTETGAFDQSLLEIKLISFQR